jgi:hypothetical protein
VADPKLIATLSSLLSSLPDIAEEKTETHATFLTGKKVFAFEPDPNNPGEQMPAFSPIDIFPGKNFLITISDPTEVALADNRPFRNWYCPSDLVFAVILSAAKDPEAVDRAYALDLFHPKISTLLVGFPFNRPKIVISTVHRLAMGINSSASTPSNPYPTVLTRPNSNQISTPSPRTALHL